VRTAHARARLAKRQSAGEVLGEKGCMDDPSAFKCSVIYGVRRPIGLWRAILTTTLPHISGRRYVHHDDDDSLNHPNNYGGAIKTLPSEVTDLINIRLEDQDYKPPFYTYALTE
jgi:hypothetical protein